MERTCESCGEGFEGRSSRARYCSERCKKRAQRAPKGAPIAVAASEAPIESAGTLSAATAEELEAAGRLDTSAGRAALLLAERLDNAHRETGAAMASLVREHRAALADALRGAGRAADGLDELRARRELKAAGA